ncbi:M4 family metallopeptidase [Planosporangium thailandense]|uniref:Neutral metalloproteinase n=1 Tax=Planosporangium thailandense TaxID=765197 RepID=A0ABX0Y623_9ACTN|nr:M4 family metallopeptidase [Planosporangium thailandense]NJC72867.1 M4 family metallopeptidase [Planosporangium thailandense]
MKRIVTAGTVASVVGLGVVAVVTPSDASTGRVDTEAFAVSHATAALHTHATEVGVTDADQFQVRNTTVDRDGTSHVRYDRVHAGLPVLGGDIVVHLDKAGTMRAMSAQPLAAPLSAPTTPTVTATVAAQAATAKFHGTGAATAPSLAIDAAGTPHLVWKTSIPGVRGEDGDTTTMTVLVDATTGAVSDSWPDHETGTGTGFNVGTVTLDTTKSGSSYQLKDPKRGGNYTVDAGNGNAVFTDADDVWGTGSLSDRQTIAVDAQYGVAETWDYYKAVHGRNGIANDGRGSYNAVHYGSGYNNAFWSDSCFCMTYGDGDGTQFNPFVALDVAGHEMSHGVTSRTAGLRYSGESGGLNEATSDIFGTMVEFYANNPKDVPDYLIGEKIRKNGQPLRYMDDPGKDGKSASCWTPSVGSLDVHYSSGVANHFFFLLAVGSGAHTVNGVAYNSPTCNGAPGVTGVGNSAAEKIWYRALTTYMTSTTNYKGARTATLNAASDLFGANSTQYKAVAAAWTAVAVS